MRAPNPFRFRALCVVSTAIIIIGLMLPPEGLQALAAWWLVYVLLFAAISIARDGIRGLAAPTLVIGAMAAFQWKLLLPVLIDSWAICVLYLLALTLLRVLWRWLKRWVGGLRAKRRPEELRPVRIVVEKRRVETDARAILRRFGFRAS